MKKHFNFCIFILFSASLYGQKWNNSPAKDRTTNPASTIVKYDDLVKITKKYGVEKNMVWQPHANNKNLKRPDKVTIKMSIEEFEEMVKKMAFNEKRVKILRQFHEVDFQKLTTISEYLELKRSYAKRYPEYLKNERYFQEDYMKDEEENSDKIILNTKGFKRSPTKQ